MNIFNLQLNDEQLNCTGLVFKAKVEHYLDKNDTYVNTHKMVLMRRKSCKCNMCYMLYDGYIQMCQEQIWPILPDNMQHEELYTLKVINEKTDWESGCVEDFDFTFTKIIKGK